MQIHEAVCEFDFHRIAELNHRVLAEEIGQHSVAQNGFLIDAHHGRNRYFVGESQNEIVGMICLTRSDNGCFRVDKKISGAELSSLARAQAIEFRLLAVLPHLRRTTLAIRLISHATREALTLLSEHLLGVKKLPLRLRFLFLQRCMRHWNKSAVRGCNKKFSDTAPTLSLFALWPQSGGFPSANTIFIFWHTHIFGKK